MPHVLGQVLDHGSGFRSRLARERFPNMSTYATMHFKSIARQRTFSKPDCSCIFLEIGQFLAVLAMIG